MQSSWLAYQIDKQHQGWEWSSTKVACIKGEQMRTGVDRG